MYQNREYPFPFKEGEVMVESINTGIAKKFNDAQADFFIKCDEKMAKAIQNDFKYFYLKKNFQLIQTADAIHFELFTLEKWDNLDRIIPELNNWAKRHFGREIEGKWCYENEYEEYVIREVHSGFMSEEFPEFIENYSVDQIEKARRNFQPPSAEKEYTIYENLIWWLNTRNNLQYKDKEQESNRREYIKKNPDANDKAKLSSLNLYVEIPEEVISETVKDEIKTITDFEIIQQDRKLIFETKKSEISIKKINKAIYRLNREMKKRLKLQIKGQWSYIDKNYTMWLRELNDDGTVNETDSSWINESSIEKIRKIKKYLEKSND